MVEGSGVEGARGTFVRSCRVWVAFIQKRPKFAKILKNLKTLVTFKLFRELRFEDTQPENSILNL